MSPYQPTFGPISFGAPLVYRDLPASGSSTPEYLYCVRVKTGVITTGYVCYKTAADASKRQGDHIDVSELPPGCVEFPS